MQSLQLSVPDAIRGVVGSCHSCREACLEAVHHCIAGEGPADAPELITLLRGCAELCQTTTNFLLRGPGTVAVITRACAQVAERCAEACSLFPEDNLLQRCAEACRRCARLCNEAATLPD